MGENYSFSVDIWSLGALAMMLLAATLPFWSEDRQELKRRACEEPLDLDSEERMSHISDSAKNLLHGMLTKCPRERLTID